MHFEEQSVGEYRIYAGALEATGGYMAAVVVKRWRKGTTTPEVFRDESMSGGHRWLKPEEALRFAMAKGKAVVEAELRAQTGRLQAA